MAKSPTQAEFPAVDTLHHRINTGGRLLGRQGKAPGEFFYPSAVVVAGNRAFIADSWNHRVQVFDLPAWTFALEFGDFFCPRWIGAAEYRGKPLLIVVDTNNDRICFHDLTGERLGTFCFQSRRFPVSARVVLPGAIEVAFEDGRTETYMIEALINSKPWKAGFVHPVSIVRDPFGCLYVADDGQRVVEKFDRDGSRVGEVLGPAQLAAPRKMVLNGNDLIVMDRGSRSVAIWDTTALRYRPWDCGLGGADIAGCDPGGAIWIGFRPEEPDSRGATFLVFDPQYRFQRRVIFRESFQPTGIAFSGDLVLISDQTAQNVFVFRQSGELSGLLNDTPGPEPIWSVRVDAGRTDIAAGPIADVLYLPDSMSLYSLGFSGGVIMRTPLRVPGTFQP
jgi:hypothetical protein